MKKFVLILILMTLIFQLSCSDNIERKVIHPKVFKTSYDTIFKPYTRYWWFASEIKKEDVKWNLDWLKSQGFGGVEIAWVYPLNRNSKTDTTYMPRYEWLSSDFRDIVDYTVKYSDTIGLACDLTFGTLWPFGDSKVKFEEATQKFGEPEWRQEITASWEYPQKGYVIDHLTPANYLPYFDRMLANLPRSRTKINQAYFIDSWEVESYKLWSDSFKTDFIKKYGYNVTTYMDSIYSPGREQILYDYMSLISEKVLKFYSDFTTSLNHKGVFSRGQVSGAPCDLISGYALMDIPEGEAMLYEPEYNSIPASAALLANKNTVSAETFTCLYGWPRDYIREEQTADLKLLADAIFANGVNHIIWHGKAHNPANSDSVNFYASTHLGFSGNLAGELKEFNRYLENVTNYMKKGKTYSRAAVYLPTEDAWRKGVMPTEKQFKWAWGFYEMRYVYFPEELWGYNPTWINKEFLSKSFTKDGKLIVNNNEFDFLYIDVDYLDYESLKSVERLVRQGLKLVLKKNPKNPSLVGKKYYKKISESLRNYPSVTNNLQSLSAPIVEYLDDKVKFQSRINNDEMFIFFPNPKSQFLKFPMSYGQSFNNETFNSSVKINFRNFSDTVKLEFKPYQSLLYKIKNGKLEQIDIHFQPITPVVKERPVDFDAPWLIKEK